MTHAPRPPGLRVRAGGFTLVELMTACMIVSIALLGVYGIFRASVDMERRLTLGWQEHQAAEAVVAQICQAIESVVAAPPVEAISTGEEADGRRFMECLTYGDALQRTLQRRKYRWDGETGVIDLRTIVYSGSQPVSIDPPAEDENIWINVEPMVIGRRLDNLLIEFRKAGSDSWEDRYTRSGSPTVVRVKATVGESSAERIVSCPLTAALTEDG